MLFQISIKMWEAMVSVEERDAGAEAEGEAGDGAGVAAAAVASAGIAATMKLMASFCALSTSLY